MTFRVDGEAVESMRSYVKDSMDLSKGRSEDLCRAHIEVSDAVSSPG